MAQYIEFRGETIEFPDSMSEAQIATVLQKQAAPEPAKQAVKEESPSVLKELGRQVGLTARAGIENAASLPGMVLDPLANITNLVTGQQTLKPFSKGVSDILTAIGLPQPKNELERAVQAGAGAMAGTGLQAAATKSVPLLQGLSKDLPKQIAASAAGGMAAQAAGENVTEAFKDPYAGMAAAIVSGTLAASGAGKLVDKGQSLKGFMTGETKPVLTMDEIKSRAQQSYRKMQDQNVYVQQKSLNDKLFSGIEDRLATENFNPQLDTHRPVAQVLDQMKQMASDPFISFSKMEQMRSAINDLRNSKDAATRRLAGSVVSEFDNYLGKLGNKDVLSIGGNAGEALKSVKEARADWRNLSRAQTIEDALKSAEIASDRPTASASELIRSGMINLAKDKRKMMSFTEAEQNAIRAVAKGGSTDTLLTVLSKFNPERSQLAMGGAIAGATMRPEIALPLAAAGFGADKLQGLLRSREGAELVNRVASGALQPIPQNMAWRGMLTGSLFKPEEQ